MPEENEIKTSVVGALSIDNPIDAIKLQIDTGISIPSDGQIYMFRGVGDVNAPFFRSYDGGAIGSSIEIKPEGAYIIDRLSVLSRHEISNALPVKCYEESNIAREEVGAEDTPLKFSFVGPMMLSNKAILTEKAQNYYTECSLLLADLWERIILPIVKAVVQKYKPSMLHIIDPALADYLANLYNKQDVLDTIDKYNMITDSRFLSDIPVILDFWGVDAFLPEEILSYIAKKENIEYFAFFLQDPGHLAILDNHKKIFAGKNYFLSALSPYPNAEPAFVIAKRIQDALKIISPRNLIISSPILLNMPNINLVERKLVELVKAKDLL